MTLTDVNIKVPAGMTMYLKPQNQHSELIRNALLLYPYINDKTISHGKAVELLRRSTGLDVGESEAIVLSDMIDADMLL